MVGWRRFRRCPVSGGVLPWYARRWQGRAGGRERFYGPVMLGLASMTLLGTAAGQSFILGQFKEPMQASLGLSGPAMSALYLLATLVGGLSLLSMGVWVDRFGLRRAYLVVLPTLAGVCVLTALAWHWSVLLLGLLGLRMLGQGLLELLSSNTVSMWYERKLGRASTVSMLTFSLGLVVLPPLVQAMLGWVGWRWTYVVIGGLVLWLTLPMWLAFVDRPTCLGQRVDGPGPLSLGHPAEPVEGSAGRSWTRAEAVRTREFWVLLMGLVFYALVLTAMVYCVNSVVADRGMPEEDGAWMISALGGSMAVVYPLVGYWADRWSVRRMQGLATLAMMVSALLLWGASSVAMVVAAGVGLGLTIALQGAVGATAWVRRFGREHLGSIRGAVQTAAITGSSVGPFVLEAGRSSLGSYDAVLLTMALSGVPVVVLAMTLPARLRTT